ncbi:MAG: TatD family hydrolase [Coriobacteriales bacterium]|nr:TatD family hydrolase [Coriobacteriales bacterium]
MAFDTSSDSVREIDQSQRIEQLLEHLQAPLFTAKKGKPVEVPTPLAPLADTHGHLTPLRHMHPAVAVARAALVGVRLLAVPVDPADDVPDVPAFLSWFDEVLHTATELLASNGDTPHCPEPLPHNTFFLAGVHPYGAQRFMEDPAVRARLLALLDHALCKGVGEFGLDYGPWNKLPADVQIAAFREHLRIAHERNLPVELHIRDADGDAHAQAHVDALRVLREEGVPAAGCDLHCYTSGPDVMTPFVELGCHVAFGGAVTFARSEDIRVAAAACPANKILCETDSPYMTPVPLRGQRCEPAMVAFSAAHVARVREEAGVATQAQTYADLWNNALRFFGMGD